jgi:hypothetical protein
MRKSKEAGRAVSVEKGWRQASLFSKQELRTMTLSRFQRIAARIARENAHRRRHNARTGPQEGESIHEP